MGIALSRFLCLVASFARCAGAVTAGNLGDVISHLGGVSLRLGIWLADKSPPALQT